MGTLETCLGHITGGCPSCKANDQNPQCSHYQKVTLKTYEVVDYAEQTQSQ